MSNAMSRSKSRWKGVLLATVATATVAPIAAKAQSMSVSLTLTPMGSTTLSHLEYIDPYDPVTIYVYGTVTGTSAPSSSYVDGMQFAYYNINGNVSSGSNANFSSGATSIGSVTGATLSSLFGGGAFNGSGGVQGAQAGTVSGAALTPTSSVVVGSTTDVTGVAKPRAASDVFVSGSNTSSQVYTSGNSVSFLLETLTFTPNGSALAASPSTPSAQNSVTFSPSIPDLTSASFTNGGSSFGNSQANYFVGLSSQPALGTEPSSTLTNYNASGSVKLVQALPGDATLDGTVNFSDLGVVLTHYLSSDTKWSDGNFLYGGNHADTVVNFSDLGLVLTNYNGTLGAAPSEVAADAAVLDDPRAVALLESYGFTPVAAVPEPTTLGLLGLAGIATLGRRRR